MTGHSPPGQLIKLGSTAAVFLMQWLLQARRAAALNKVPVQHPLPKLLETTYHAHPYTICTSVAFGFDQFLTPQLIITYPHPHHILKLLTYPDSPRDFWVQPLFIQAIATPLLPHPRLTTPRPHMQLLNPVHIDDHR